MPFKARCPSCGLDYNLTDRMHGRQLRCKQCQGIFAADAAEVKGEPPAASVAEVIPAGPPRKPRTPQREDEEDRPRSARKQSSGVPIGCVIGGIAAAGALVLLLGCGGLGLLLYSRVKSDTPLVTVQGGAPQPAGPQNLPQNPPWNPGGGLPAVIAWDVKADPSPRPPAKVSDPGRKVTLRGDFPNILIVPSTPSPFVSSGLNDFPPHKREIWDLETMEKTGEIKGYKMTDKGVLSPDGAYVASHLNEASVPFIVVSCKDGSKAFQFDSFPLGMFDFLDFAGPRRLIIGTRDARGRVYHLYEVPGGRKEREVVTPREHDEKSDALSPGGKYLAFVSGGDVLIYDLDQGRPAGKFAILSKNRNGLRLRQLAFSPDGKELAVMFDGVRGLRLLTWDLVGNRPGVDHTLPTSFVRSLKTPGHHDGPNEYFGRHLEWLGDGSGWLVRGEVVIEKATGAQVWRLDLQGEEWRDPRHVVGSTHVAKIGGPLTARTLELIEIRRGQVVVRPRDPEPVKPPEGEPRHIALADDATPQPAEIDPLPAPKGALPDSLTLTAQPADIKKVLFSRPDVAQAAVVTITGAQRGVAPRPVAVERYDLTTGQSLGKRDLFQARGFAPGEVKADLSGDGTLLALGDWQDPRRVEAWSLAEGKRVGSWLPYEKSPGGFSHVHALAVVDATHVLTVNLPGDVVLWQMPECKAVYQWRCFAQFALPLSPGRRYAVLRGNKGFVLCNLKTGEARGRFPFPAGQQVLQIQAGSFRPDGKDFAAVLSFGDGRGPSPRRLVRWDATTGNVIGSQPIAHQPRNLDWCGDGHLLLDGSLFDLKQGAPVCAYVPMNGWAAHGSPDQRFWFTHAAKLNEAARLSAVRLPDEAAKQAAAQLAAGQVQLVLKPGMKVSVEFDFAGPAADAAAYRKNFEERIRNHLNELGLTLAEGQPVKLRLSAREESTDGKVHAVLTRREGGKVVKSEPANIPLKRLTCEASLTDGQGRALVQPRNQVFEFRDLNLDHQGADDPAAVVNREQSRRLWDSFANWVYLVAPPPWLARQGEAVMPWPKTVVLGQARGRRPTR
jgi:hypothetical protein